MIFTNNCIDSLQEYFYVLECLLRSEHPPLGSFNLYYWNPVYTRSGGFNPVSHRVFEILITVLSSLAFTNGLQSLHQYSH